jgi:hypothetical protein
VNTGVTVRITDAVVVRVGESAVRVLDAPTNTVVAIGSSTAGPVGPQGTQGNQGAQGAQGVQGVQGVQGAQGSTTIGTAIDVTAASTTATPVIVRAVASQTGDLLQFKDSAGTDVTRITGGGIVKVNGGSGSEISMYADGAGGLFLFGTPSDASAYAEMGARNSALEVNAKNRPTRYIRTDDGTVMQVRGMATQSATLQEWQNSSATVLASVTSSGEVVAALIDGGSA